MICITTSQQPKPLITQPMEMSFSLTCVPPLSPRTLPLEPYLYIDERIQINMFVKLFTLTRPILIAQHINYTHM